MEFFFFCKLVNRKFFFANLTISRKSIVSRVELRSHEAIMRQINHLRTATKTAFVEKSPPDGTKCRRKHAVQEGGLFSANAICVFCALAIAPRKIHIFFCIRGF